MAKQRGRTRVSPHLWFSRVFYEAARGPRLATIQTSRPRRSLSSPWMYCPSSLAAAQGRYWAETKSDADPSRLRNPLDPARRPSPEDPARRPSPLGWRGLTPRWPRSLRLGSASGFKVALARGERKGLWYRFSHLPKKCADPRRDSPVSATSTGAPRASRQGLGWPPLRCRRHRPVR